MLRGLVLDLLRIPPMRSFPSATSGVAIAQNLAQMLKFQKIFQLEFFFRSGDCFGSPIICSAVGSQDISHTSNQWRFGKPASGTYSVLQVMGALLLPYSGLWYFWVPRLTILKSEDLR